MDNAYLEEIRRHLKEIVDAKDNAPFTAKVINVADDTCSIELVSGLQIDDVKLKSSTGSDNYLLLIPKLQTQVTVISYTGTVDNLTVIKIDEVEKIVYKQAGLDIEIDSTDNKIKIANDSVSLKDILDALTGLLKQFKVFTPVGPSGTPLPDTIVKITQVETKFNQLLK